MLPATIILSSLTPSPIPHPLNWAFGWSSILLAFITGAILGLQSHRDDYLGGYASYRRRMTRLGHIALAALGMLNVLFGLSPLPPAGGAIAKVASACFVAGAILMPTVCFLSAWRKPLRHLFAAPVLALVAAVVLTLIGGLLWKSDFSR